MLANPLEGLYDPETGALGGAAAHGRASQPPLDVVQRVPGKVARHRCAGVGDRVADVPEPPVHRLRGEVVERLVVDRDAAATKPMKARTAEKEQNGVATPSPAAVTFATPSRRPPSSARVRSRLTNERATVTTKMIPTSSSTILTVS
jgi:hypothetical protein